MLIELLLAGTLLLVVLGATLASLTTFESNSRVNQLQNDNQQAVRAAVDQVARELRNHAIASSKAPQGVASLGSYDMVVQTTGPSKPANTANDQNIQRIRYCLDSSTLRNEKLYSQTQTWATASPPAVPSTAACPDPAWGNQRVLADKITNRFDAASPTAPRDRPVFTPNSATLGQITRLDLTLYLDTTPGGGPVNSPDEIIITSGIFLRNHNEAPAASFDVTATGSRHIVMSGSAASDPESQPLSYAWSIDGSTIPGAGVTNEYGPTTSGSHTVVLTVTDPGGLSASASQAVTVP
jgi:hypothetical protein